MDQPCLFSEDKAKGFISDTTLFLNFFCVCVCQREEKASTLLIFVVSFSCLSQERMSMST